LAVLRRAARNWRVIAASVSVFLATVFVRYLALNGFSNDHYQYLAGAQQMLTGEWPTRDFVDPGQPLMYALSAGAQLILGRTLLAEAALTTVAFGLAAACVVVAGRHASQMLTVGVIAALISVVAFPRPGSYPIALLYAAAPLVIWTSVGKSSYLALVGPIVLVAVAFLFRRDHGFYLALATIAAMLVTPEDRRSQRLRILVFVGAVLLVLTPYLLFVSEHQGLWRYIVAAFQLASRESDRTELHAGNISGSEAVLFYGVRAIALVALAVALLDYRQGRSDVRVAAPLVVSAILVNVNFLREPLAARLPEVIGPAVLVAAWLTGRAFRVQPRIGRAAAVAVAVVVWSGAAVHVSAVGRAGEQLARTDLRLGVGQWPRLAREKTMQLTARYAPQQLPDARLAPLIPFFDYLDRCTTTRHRLLVTGNAPEIYVYARRPFAAGQSRFVEGYNQSDAERERLVARAGQQVIAFVLVLSDQHDGWRTGLPELASFVDERFRPLTEIAVDAERSVRVLVHGGLPPSRVDRTTGWACFTSHEGEA
jgi:hypothetical protein